MHDYRLIDTSDVPSPTLLVYPEVIRANLQRAVKAAGGPERLRPHAKTHKTREIARLGLDLGITKHKCATLAEAEMLAQAGAADVLIAYPLVGPNLRRLADLVEAHPKSRFAVTADDANVVRELANAVVAKRQSVDVLLDLDVGQHRTGMPICDAALDLYGSFANLPGLRPGGLHVYDGHNRQPNRSERAAAVEEMLGPVRGFRAELERRRLPVPRLVLGGTPTFPVHAALPDVGVECSPGTFVLHDHGYSARYPDLPGFEPAAVLLTRVISRPTPTRVTLDLGTKAVASDPPAGQRVHLLDFPPFEAVAHNEEHFVVETVGAASYKPGDVVYALPAHICPTVALYPRLQTVEGGRITGAWAVASRDRV
ncbi:MAG: D-TA family PLP-dependent enzyme [Gemmataceae bacterium]